jgi:hypothetical protein
LKQNLLTLFQQLDFQLKSKLSGLSFEWDAKNRCFTKVINEETIGMVYAWPSRKGARIEILPTVAFDNTRIRKELIKMQGAGFEPNPRIAHAHLAILADRFVQSWSCQSQDEIEVVINDFTKVLVHAGLPFLERWNSLAKATELLKMAVENVEPRNVVVNYAEVKLLAARAAMV